MTIKLFLKPKLDVCSLAFMCALYLAVINNCSFFKAVVIAVEKSAQRSLLFESAVFIGLTLLFFVLLLILASAKPIFKAIVMLLLILAALISYFMDSFGVIIDDAMIQNLMETDFHEAFDLVTPKLLLQLTLLGVLPAIWVYHIEIQYKSLVPELVKRITVLSCALALLGGIVFFNYKDFSFVLRNNHHLRYLINPNYPIYSLFKYAKTSLQPQLVIQPLGVDAKQTKTWQERGKKTVLVLVVGETARAENFAINGYSKATNPRLSQQDIINFPDAHSCGTATAVSVPCMFSNLKQSGFSDSAAKQNENLLDVLTHAGVNVLWLDNNSGCKGVCQRVPTKNLESLKDPELCANGECYDEILLQELKKTFTDVANNLVIVLHQKGSHGPAYYKRHPANFTRFSPECTRNEVQDCSQTEITNAYDNTIAYTDHVLAELIELLKTQAANFNTAMLYMSDHGESLGENGIYLHGLPYAFAPDQQTHIPFIMWLSDSYYSSFGINKACLNQRSKLPYSHDNLFHSVLGMLEINTNTYEPDYDILNGCRIG